DRRVAQSAGDADAGDSVALEYALHADDRVRLEQGYGVGRIVQVRLAGGDRGRDAGRHLEHVHLQAERERLLGAHAGTDAAILLAGDCAVQLRLRPERLAAEGIEAEDLLSLGEEPIDILLGRLVD